MEKQFFYWISFHVNEEGIFFPSIQIAYLDILTFGNTMILQSAKYYLYRAYIAKQMDAYFVLFSKKGYTHVMFPGGTTTRASLDHH
jgi:hypothetical protein